MGQGTGITFGSWLKQRRRELGITQEELADRIGCSETAVRKIELGERHPSGQIAQLLADYLSIAQDEREAFIAFARTGRSAHIASETTPGEAGMHAPWRNTHLHQTNMLALLMPLIGREEEEETARTYVLNPKVRLLTLTGPPGIGKTRLAIQVASSLVEHFEDGVFLVELSAVVDSDLVLLAVASTLGVQEKAGLSIESLLVDYLHERKMLLFLDNFEQVVNAAGSIVKLMEACPWLKVLVTSREALHVRGERRLSVTALRVPDKSFFLGRAGHQDEAVAALARYSSVQLFIERAHNVNPDFKLTQQNAVDVATICVELEGLPLAIELAAARSNHFSASEMCAALNNRLTLLTGGDRHLPSRHRTLRSAIAWSYDLLDKAEQALFRNLGVFAGGCTLAAIQAVNKTGDKELTSFELFLDMAQGLVGKNLVRLSAQDEKSEDARYYMLEAIREYALEMLEASSEIKSVRQRHADYFLTLAETGAQYTEGQYQNRWLDQIEGDYSNIRAGMLFLFHEAKSKVDGAALELALRLGIALEPFWYKRGLGSEGVDWLKSLLELQSSMSSFEEAVDNKLSLSHTPKALELRLGAIRSLGLLTWFQGDLLSASKAYEENLSTARKVGDKVATARALNNLGMVMSDKGELAIAADLYEEALSIARELGESKGVSRILNNLGVIAHEQKDYARARRYYGESLDMRRQLEEPQALPAILNNLGSISFSLGDAQAATAFYSEAFQIADAGGDKGTACLALLGLGDAAIKQENYSIARLRYMEGLRIGQEVGRKLAVAEALEGLSKVEDIENKPLTAGQLRAIAEMMRTTLRSPQENAGNVQFGDWLKGAHLSLSQAGWHISWAEGEEMSIEEVIEHMLAL